MLKRVMKRIAQVVGSLVVLVLVVGGGYAWAQARAWDASLEKVYDVPLTAMPVSTDPAVLARGKHLVEGVMACTGSSCHGPDLAGGTPVVMGPVGVLAGPNVTAGGLGALYNPSELARLLRHGIKKDGRTLRMMPVQDFGWQSDADLAAVVSYLQTVPAVDKPSGATNIKLIGKVLDRRDALVFDVARRIDHQAPDLAPPPAPTAAFGRYVGKQCLGCHGAHLSGGPIPGAPAELGIPLNLTPDPTGLAGWSYQDLDVLLTTGKRKNGAQLGTFMPVENFSRMDETEKRALYAYLMSVPPLPLGNR